jgi:alpha-ribazole phosphatase/probable phosphoglycerate mutase
VSEETTTIDLIRHGEPVGGSRYRGQTDDPLSELGWAQMRVAVGDHRPWTGIVTSPLSRCAAFAHELGARHDLPVAEDARLMEIGFGAWEGRTAADIEAIAPGELGKFWNDPIGHTPPGAEPVADFHARVVGAWNDLIARHRGRHVLVVCHAGVVRACVSHVLGAPLDRMFRIKVPNAAITRIAITHHGESAFPALLFHAGSL